MADRFPEPTEAKRYLKRKLNVKTDAWDDLKWGEHAHAFTVAHSMQANVLDDIHGLMNRAMAEGQAFGDFRKGMLDMMGKRGWYGKAGKTQEDKTYINWRIRIIYDTNMRTAFAAARYREQLESAEARPIWVYVSKLHGKNRRQEHILLHDKAFRYDDPFWSTYYPPNGWGCQCRVTTKSEHGAVRDSVKVLQSGSDGKPPAISGEDWGKFDPTWKYNPGRESLAPKFAKFDNIKASDKKNGTHQMEEIRNKYQEDLNKSRMTEQEFSAYMRRVKDVEYRGAGYILQVGNLESKRFVALSLKTGITDSKIMATDTQLWHSQGNKIKRVDTAKSRTDLTPAEKNKLVKQLEDIIIPQEMFGDVYEQLREPERIYIEKKPHTKMKAVDIHFVKTLLNGKVIKIIVRTYIDLKSDLYLSPEIITMEKIDDMYKGKGMNNYEEIRW
jgi:uncharacterized protein with gpF-like domain